MATWDLLYKLTVSTDLFSDDLKNKMEEIDPELRLEK